MQDIRVEVTISVGPMHRMAETNVGQTVKLTVSNDSLRAIEAGVEEALVQAVPAVKQALMAARTALRPTSL